jgi:hypothetical protein
LATAGIAVHTTAAKGTTNASAGKAAAPEAVRNATATKPIPESPHVAVATKTSTALESTPAATARSCRIVSGVNAAQQSCCKAPARQRLAMSGLRKILSKMPVRSERSRLEQKIPKDTVRKLQLGAVTRES